MAYLWIKDRDVAQDVLQSVFEKAWQRKDELEKMKNAKGWMVKSVKNETMQHFRSSKKTTSLGELEIEEEQNTGEEDSQEKLRLVFGFLELLPDKQKEIFQLREVEGLTYEEIAEYLEISIEQVKVNLHRARKTLRDYLKNRLANHER